MAQIADSIKYESENERNEQYKEKIDNIAEVGACIKFGKYPQTTAGDDSTPIEWIVLSQKGNEMLLISKRVLDCQKFNSERTDITWENCSLRKWMNGAFLNKAFSAEEQAKIQNTTVFAGKNPRYSTNPGYATTDKVFLLSIKEAEKYFTTDESRMCAPTAYAKEQGAYTNDRDKTASGEASCWWWLRSPGGTQRCAAAVGSDGSVVHYGLTVRSDLDSALECVRPALWIDLDD